MDNKQEKDENIKGSELPEQDIKQDSLDEKKEEKVDKKVEEKSTEEKEDVKKADEELIALKDAAIASLNDQIKRNMAEFDNFRKRTQKEKTLMFELGAKGVLEKLLPVIDNFERALEAGGQCEDNGFRKGVELIYKQFLNTLDELDVKEIDALHKPFNPDLHHAVAHEVSDEYDENIVINVMQKGYTYKDKVIRYSMVSVAN